MIGLVGAQLAAHGCADTNVHRLSLSQTVVTRVSLQVAVQSPTVRDSAGVRIIDNAARMDAPIRFALGARAVFEVGGLEKSEATEFNHMAGFLNGVRLYDGRFAVIDMNRIHYFDSRPRRIRIVGRNGSGPAEFGTLLPFVEPAVTHWLWSMLTTDDSPSLMKKGAWSEPSLPATRAVCLLGFAWGMGPWSF